MDLLLNESEKERQRLWNESGLLWLLRSRVKKDGKMLSFHTLLADDLRPLKLRGARAQNSERALSEVYRSLRYPYKTPACRAIVQQFAAWLHYFGASTAKHVKRWRPTFAFFRLATTHAESSIRGGNFVWKRNVQPNFLQIIC